MVKLHENLKQLEWKPTKLLRPFLPDRTCYCFRFSPLAVTSCSFPCFHRSLKRSCCFQEPRHRSQVLSEEDAIIGDHPRGILHKSKSTSHMFAISTVQCMPVEWGWFVLVSLAVVWNCGTVSVPYTCIISLLKSTLFSFGYKSLKMLIPTPKYFIHNCLDNAKHQCYQKFKVQLYFWSAKQAFPQLTTSVLAKQEEPERMKARCA